LDKKKHKKCLIRNNKINKINNKIYKTNNVIKMIS